MDENKVQIILNRLWSDHRFWEAILSSGVVMPVEIADKIFETMGNLRQWIYMISTGSIMFLENDVIHVWFSNNNGITLVYLRGSLQLSDTIPNMYLNHYMLNVEQIEYVGQAFQEGVMVLERDGKYAPLAHCSIRCGSIEHWVLLTLDWSDYFDAREYF